MTEQSQPGGQSPQTASEILSAAETLAEQIRGRAHADADAIRARAGSESEAAQLAIKDRLQRLSALADGMLARLGEMRVELDELSASLDAPPAAAAAVTAPEDRPPAAAVAAPEDGPPAVAVPAPGRVQPVAAVPHPDSAPAPAAPPEPPEPPAAGVDDAGARLIALNLALSDTPRDEAVRQLRDQVPDAERLVDEVYASVDR